MNSVGCSTSDSRNTCVTQRFEQNKHFLSKCVHILHMFQVLRNRQLSAGADAALPFKAKQGSA